MTVGELRELIAGVDDNIQIFTPDFDHSMRDIVADLWFVDKEDHYHYSEYYSDDDLIGEKVRALIIQ